jgi:GPH family glycoside/pentoside/hexuronide:cation symporter
MTAPPSAGRLAWPLKAAYGMPAFALAIVGIPVYVHIPKFYSDVVGLDIAWVGIVILLVRMFDAVSDPFLGIVSDRTRTPMGRRRPFILGGGLALAAVTVLLFVPPEMAPRQAQVWFATTVFALFLCWTVVTVPYEALGPELTSDYTERISLFAVRDGLLIAGTLMAAAAPALLDAWMGTDPPAARERTKFLLIAMAYAPLLAGTCVFCVWRVREHGPATPVGVSCRRTDLRGIARNRPFLILLLSYTIGALGSNLPAALILYYVEVVLQSTRANLFLLLYFASGILLLPVWIKVSQRYGKKEAWLASMLINTGAFSGVFFLGPGDEWRYAVLVVISGLGFGATLALPSAIQADVIDYDEFLTGCRQEGWYIGIWSVVKKLTAAVGVGAGLTILGTAGYAPGRDQPDEVILALRVMYALVPCICNLVAFAVALAFPISKQAHERILAGIAQQQAGEEPADPFGRKKKEPLDSIAALRKLGGYDE